MTSRTELHDPKTILSSREPLTSGQRLVVLDRIHQLERDIAAIQHEACVAARDRDALRALIGNDQHALSFQSLAQYRANLTNFITKKAAS